MAKKKKAVVLGVGAEKGLGAAASRRFAKEGYHVLVAGRTTAKVEKVADSIRVANGSAAALTVDDTKEAEVIALWDKAMADDADGVPTRSSTAASRVSGCSRACPTARTGPAPMGC